MKKLGAINQAPVVQTLDSAYTLISIILLSIIFILFISTIREIN